MTYEEMKRRVQRLEVLRAQMETLRKIQESPVNYIALNYTDDRILVQPGWISEANGFEGVSGAIKEVAAEISEEIKAEIAQLQTT